MKPPSALIAAASTASVPLAGQGQAHTVTPPRRQPCATTQHHVARSGPAAERAEAGGRDDLGAPRGRARRRWSTPRGDGST